MTTASENPTDKMQYFLCSLSRNWWAFVLRGVLALIIAVLAFVMPAQSLLALTLVFGAFAFADGALPVLARARMQAAVMAELRRLADESVAPVTVRLRCGPDQQADLRQAIEQVADVVTAAAR